MDFQSLMQQGAAHAWLYIPAAILLGALHGLEPGHSKTMMAAFIIAIRGTVAQAVLLGLSAAISHSLVIWALAAMALKFGDKWGAETTEPYFQLFSGIVVAAMAVWMFFRLRKDAAAEAAHHHHHHHGHDEGKVINTGHGGLLELEIFEDGVPPVFRLRGRKGKREVTPDVREVGIETVRADGTRQVFSLSNKGGWLESVEEIPEPREFQAVVTVSHGDHSHTYRVNFEEGHDHAHGHHHHDHGHGHDDHGHDHHHHHHGDDAEEFQDAHEAAHAEDIRRRFANRQVTTWQIVLFGLTGGLMPCPAAFTVLIVCLQVKEYTLGFALVAAFSLGLALIMVTVGAVAALGVKHAEKKMKGFTKMMRRAPYASCVLLMVIAFYMAWHGLAGLKG